MFSPISLAASRRLASEMVFRSPAKRAKMASTSERTSTARACLLMIARKPSKSTKPVRLGSTSSTSERSSERLGL